MLWSMKSSFKRKKEGFQTFRTLGDLDVQRRADQGHEGGVEVDRVVVGHGEVHAEQPLKGVNQGER